MSYETSVQRLAEIVDALERQEMPLDRALELFEEGIARLRDATAELTRAAAAVKVLRERADGVLEATDLDA
jgi:exodeoxyribonuclease VII small subunit